MLNDITIEKKVPFLQFDKIYESVKEMQDNQQTDGIFINRFVYVTSNESVWMKQYNLELGGYYTFIAYLKPNIPYSNYGVLKISKLVSHQRPKGIVYCEGSIYNNLKSSIEIEFAEQTIEYASFTTEIENKLREVTIDQDNNPIVEGAAYSVNAKFGDKKYFVGYWSPVFTSEDDTFFWLKIG